MAARAPRTGPAQKGRPKHHAAPRSTKLRMTIAAKRKKGVIQGFGAGSGLVCSKPKILFCSALKVRHNNWAPLVTTKLIRDP